MLLPFWQDSRLGLLGCDQKMTAVEHDHELHYQTLLPHCMKMQAAENIVLRLKTSDCNIDEFARGLGDCPQDWAYHLRLTTEGNS